MRTLKLVVLAVGLVLLLTAGSCSTTEESGEPIPQATDDEATTDEEPDDDGAEEETETEDPPPAPEPDGEFTSSCDYVLGDFTESRQGYRFVGDARVRNTGNIGIRLTVTGIWEQLGAAPVRVRKEVRLPIGKRRTIRLTHVASSDEIDLHQSADARCRVRVRIVDTIGDAQ